MTAASKSRPPPASLEEVRARMAKRNDEHARAERLMVRPRPGPVPVRELSRVIREDNAARAVRTGGERSEEAEFARVEILRCAAALAGEVARLKKERPELAEFLGTVDMFGVAVAEHLRAQAQPATSAARSSTLENLREAFAILERMRGR